MAKRKSAKKRITSKQRSARRKNIAIARKARKKKGKWGGKTSDGRFEQVGKFIVDHKKKRILNPKTAKWV